jgi:hypothetical protein
VPDLEPGLPDRQVILQVADAEPRVTDEAAAPLIDELRRQVEVSTIGWPSSPSFWPRNRLTR